MNDINWNLNDEELVDWFKFEASKPVFIGRGNIHYNRALDLVKKYKLEHRFVHINTMLLIL